jgi:hypothetical protein
MRALIGATHVGRYRGDAARADARFDARRHRRSALWHPRNPRGSRCPEGGQSHSSVARAVSCQQKCIEEISLCSLLLTRFCASTSAVARVCARSPSRRDTSMHMRLSRRFAFLVEKTRLARAGRDSWSRNRAW